MNGLEKILQKIEEGNELEIKRISDDAKARADIIVSNAVEEAKKEAEEIIENAKKKAILIGENAKSGSEAYVKREELAVKTKLVNECINHTLEHFDNMAPEEYFECVFDLVCKYAHKGEGEIAFNSVDIGRLPKGLIKKINSALKNKDASVELREEPVNIKNGFVLIYGGIEENCTFDALVADRLDEIKDKLFAEIKG